MKTDTRIKMSKVDFMKIGPYEDEEYLSFNYEETLFHKKGSLDAGHQITAGQKIFWGYVILSSQIRNGGIAQYYWNTNGDYIEGLKDVLKMINNKKFTGLVNKSTELFLENKTRLKEYKRKGFDFYEKWADIFDKEKTDDFFYDNVADIEKTVYEYVRVNPEDFIK